MCRTRQGLRTDEASTVREMAVSLRDRNRLAAMDEVRQVAFELMSEHGFGAVTVEQIAARSSVSPSTIYRYFGTKEALVMSSRRPTKLVERVARDSSTRSELEALMRAAGKVWGNDESATIELGLIAANPALVVAWERQFLDLRESLADVFAARRGATSTGTRDRVNAAAGLAVLMTMLIAWNTGGGGRKALDKLLAKAATTLSPNA